jgi:hypothetical protein
MAESEANIWFGSILKKESAAPGTYVDFGLEITNVSGIGITRSSQDKTHMASPDGYTEVLFGMKTSKPFTIAFNLIPAGLADLQTALEAGAVNWQFVWPDGTNITVKAGISDLDMAGGGTPDGKMEGSLEFTPTGKGTLAAAA